MHSIKYSWICWEKSRALTGTSSFECPISKVHFHPSIHCVGRFNRLSSSNSVMLRCTSLDKTLELPMFCEEFQNEKKRAHFLLFTPKNLTELSLQ